MKPILGFLFFLELHCFNNNLAHLPANFYYSNVETVIIYYLSCI